MQRVVLHADDGKILTNGEIYGVHIFLAEGVEADEFYEITKEEYERMIASEIIAEETEADAVLE